MKVAIVGGGLAGLAAAVGLGGRGWQIDLFEARRQLGGRAGSFYDATSDSWVDHCQHVGMACCTNLVDFCRRTGLADHFRRDGVLRFFGPDGRCYRFAATRWLPAPLHLATSLLRLGYLSRRDRLGIARALWRLARMKTDGDRDETTVGDWLRAQKQSATAIERFWSVVLVSALGEELDRASLAHARKVFVDGFLASREAYQVDIPQVPLSELYGERLQSWLADRGVTVHLGTSVRRIEGVLPLPEEEGTCSSLPLREGWGEGHQLVRDAARVSAVVLADETRIAVDAALVALPWRRVRDVFDETLAAALPELAAVEQVESSPITGVHLWFDREITHWPHAVLVGRLSQWLFNRGCRASDGASPAGHYYQVVISASRGLAGRPRNEIIEQIISELADVWPAAREARLLHARTVSEQAAVFSARPGIDRLRPPQQTAIANLALAGDWTRTGWPSTMEGAVRSGYLAAEVILRAAGQPERLLVPELPRGWLARWMVR